MFEAEIEPNKHYKVGDRVMFEISEVINNPIRNETMYRFKGIGNEISFCVPESSIKKFCIKSWERKE